jgi:hypothetical protein
MKWVVVFCALFFLPPAASAQSANVTPCYIVPGQLPCQPTGTLTPLPVAPSSTGAAGLTPVVGGSAASSQVLKASAGNLYSAYANSTVSGYLMIFNATAAPSNGSTTAGTASGNLVQCVGPSTNPFLSFDPGPPEAYSVGITAVFSSTSCATLTLSATAFFHGSVQ